MMRSAVRVLASAVVCSALGWSGPTPVSAQGSYYLDFVGSMNAPAGNGSDCWGWTGPGGEEYAIMGYRDGIMIVQTAPVFQQVDLKPGPTGSGGYIWRDFKTYGNYMYSVSEASGGLSGISVYDMTYLPDSARYVGSFSTNGGSAYTSHSINIDEAKGFAYVEGSGGSQGTRILSLANPENPAFVGAIPSPAGSIHDVYAHNDTVYVAEGSAHSWSIWDATNKNSPQMLVRISIPSSGYVHNIWPSADGNYCVTTEETATKTVKVWDISDYGNVQLVGQYLAPNGMCHNAHWMGDFHVNSHYESGIQLVDVSDPTNPVEWDRVDIWPADDGTSYNGTWGAYPFTQNGHIYASNTDGKLWVFAIVNDCPTAGTTAPLDPADGAEYVNQPHTFTWDDVGADSYDLQVDEDPAFGSPDIDANVAVPQYDVSGLPLEASCYWRVRSVNSCGASDWSAPRAFTTGCIVATTGDVNADGVVNSTDIISLVDYVFKSGAAPQPVEAAGDVDCSTDVNSTDVISMVNYVFKGGTPPCNVCSIL